MVDIPEGLADFFSKAGSSAEQLFVWQVLGNIVGGLMAPVINDLQQAALSIDSNTVLDPQTVAGLVAQGIVDQAAGEGEVNKSGLSASRFDHLVIAAGNSLDFGAVVSAYQRGLIEDGDYDPTDVSLHGAAASAAIREGWLPILKKLAVAIPSVAEVMNAWLEGQIGEDEARTRYLAAGGDPTWFQTSYNANGQAPTPVEALELLNRGIIPENGTGPDALSYEQAFREGPWRNKWLKPFLALREYLPPPRTVTAMYHAGQLDHATAATLLTKQGLTSDLVAAYLTPAATSSTTTEKTLAKTDILGLYADGLINAEQAVNHLVALKYTQSDAELLIELQDFKTTKSQLDAGVTRVRTLYQGGKITRGDAVSELEALDIANDLAGQLVDTWDITSSTPVRLLTPAQIVDAWYYELIPSTEALNALESLGYDDIDAWLLLSIKSKGPLADVPRPKGAANNG